MTDFDLIIFDCDGTLVDSEYLNNLATCQVLAEEGLEHYDMAYAMKHFVGIRFNQTLRAIEAREGITFPEDMARRYITRVRELADRYMKPVHGAPELVEAAARQAKICVASNGQRDNVIFSLKKNGLLDFFPDEHIFTGAMVANPKPAPDLLILAAQRMKANPARCLLIEDSPAGVQAGVAARIPVIGFTGTHPRPEPYKEKLLKAGAGAVYTSLIHIRDDLPRAKFLLSSRELC